MRPTLISGQPNSKALQERPVRLEAILKSLLVGRKQKLDPEFGAQRPTANFSVISKRFVEMVRGDRIRHGRPHDAAQVLDDLAMRTRAHIPREIGCSWEVAFKNA
jgi:hypothetical protein